MSGSSHEEILHKIVDGEATPDEVASLTRILEGDPILRRQYDRILALTSTLGGVGLVEPPPELRAEILRAIHQRPRPGQRVSWLESIREGFRRRLLVRETLVFAGGALVGVLVLLGVRDGGSPLSQEDVTGTMVGLSAGPDTSPLDQVPVQLEGAEGAIRTFSFADGLQVEIELLAREEAVLILSFDPGSFEPISVHQQHASLGVEVRPDRVLVRQMGQNRVDVRLRGSAVEGGPLRVEVSAGEGWFEHTLQARERP